MKPRYEFARKFRICTSGSHVWLYSIKHVVSNTEQILDIPALKCPRVHGIKTLYSYAVSDVPLSRAVKMSAALDLEPLWPYNFLKLR